MATVAGKIKIQNRDIKKERNTMKKESIAKQLTLEELKAMPRATVIWVEMREKEENGVLWYSLMPAMIISTGEDLTIVGGDAGGYFEREIVNEEHFRWFSENGFWDQEPTEDQVNYGLSEKEYNEMPESEIGNVIMPNLVTAITSKKLTFNAFCEQAQIKKNRLLDCLTGKNEFTRNEITQIKDTLDLTGDQITDFFFPEIKYLVLDKVVLLNSYSKYCPKGKEV